MAEGSTWHRRREHAPGWPGLRADFRASRSRFFRHSSRDHRNFVLFVIGIGIVLRVLRLNGPITYDEAFTYVHYAGRSFGFLLSDYSFTSNHILYSALARISTLVFGVHPWSLRLPALLAGILAMPLFYAFARFVFNRHIAVILLCLVAVSGPFVEYSAMARGYALNWFFLGCSLLAARHFIKSENAISLALLALGGALGMWASPAMIYPAMMCYLWSALQVSASYKTTVRRRELKLVGSFLLFIALCVLFYAPVIMKQGLDQLLHHPSNMDHTWRHFRDTQQERSFEVWAYFTGTASVILAFLGTVGVTYAAYVSAKYRMLLFALVVATVPLVLLQRMVPSPPVWIFSLLVLHLGSAIGLYYLLKLVQDKLAPGFTKAQRTLTAGLFVLFTFGWYGLRGEGDPVERYPEAVPAAAWITAHVRPGDRVFAMEPWDAPVAFHVRCDHGDPRLFSGDPRGDAAVLVLVAPGMGQTPEGVLRDGGSRTPLGRALHGVGAWQRLTLYSNR